MNKSLFLTVCLSHIFFTKKRWPHFNLLFNDREIIKSNNKKELLREIDNLLNKSEHKYTSETYFMSAEKGIKNFDKIFN